MRKFVGLLVVWFALVIGGQAEGQVVTFNEVVPTSNPILGSVVCAGGTGFSFFSDHFHVIGAYFPQDYSSNDTTHIGYESGRGFPITMQRVGGGTFSLLSLDAAEFYSVAPPDRPDAEMLTITGFRQGGGTVSYTVNLDGIYDGPGGVVDFEHFVLPSTFVNLTSVVFTGLREGNVSGGVAIDNIAYQLAAPEVLAACVVIPLPSDTPTVSLASPLAGNVAGTVLVEAVATDNLGVASVQFTLDGVNLGAADVTAPYSMSWDTTTVADGPHTITVEARDAANNLATASVVVTVRNVPIVTTTPHYLELDGVDDYLLVADGAGLSFGNGGADTPLTVETWFRPDSMARHQLLGKWGESSNNEYKLHIVSGLIRLDLRDNSAQATVAAYTSNSYASLIGNWHHLAVTYDGRGGATAANGITIYLDGVAVPVVRINNPAYVAMENLTAPLQIGRESTNWRQYDGALDELRLWHVARTPSEIQTSMTTELSGVEAGLVAYWKFNEGVGGTVADDSPGNHAGTLYNGPVWVAGGPMAPAVPDVTAPDITNIGTSNLTASGITVTFTTSEATTGWVSLAPNLVCPCTDVSSSATGLTHVVTLTSLAPDTLYQFVVKATDGAGNLQIGPATVFRTLVLPVDAVPPTVVMVRPSAGTVSGTVVVEATATDNFGVGSVQFKLDGVNLGAADVTAPYSMSWDTTTVADGPHTITVEARDAANNVGTASVVVTVSQPPVTTTPHYLELDGVDDYLLVADGAGLSFGNGGADTPLTMEFWFRPDSMARHQLLGKWGESSNNEYKLHIVSGLIRLDLRDNSAQATVAAYTSNSYASLIGNWHHLAVTYDGRGGATAANGITIYLDGVAVPVVRINNPAYVAMENLTAPLQIGRESTNWRQYDGALDELRLWHVARTPSEIQTSMTTELSGVEAGLVAYWKFNEGVGGTVADDSPGNHAGTLYNGPVWVAGGPMAPAVPDVTAPDITNIGTSNLTASGITVTFTTSEATTGWVSLAPNLVCPCTDVSSSATGLTHVVTLTSLAPDTLYQFVVKATDGAGNLQIGPATVFRTLVLPVDAVPPTVVMVRPSAGTVSGTVVVEATATDNFGVGSVQFKLDGVNLGAADVTAPYSMSWDTTTVADGPHTITVEARDAANNVGTASVVVTVSQPPVTTTPHYLDLDGVDDYLLVADAAGLSFGNGGADTPLTMEFWFRPDSMARHQLLGKWGESSNNEYKLHIVSGLIRLDLRDNSAQATVAAYTSNSYASLIGNWHHLAVTYDGRGGATAANGITIYLDGVAVPVVRINNPAYVAMENLTAPLQIGRESTNWRQYDGALDELRLWHVARTPSEIQTSMTTELSGVEAGLVAYWKFNEGVGGMVADDSPGNHTGTLYNGPVWVAGWPPD